MMKVVDELDEGSQAVLAHAPIAALGYQTADGRLRTTFVGGKPGFARVDSPKRLTFTVPTNEPPAQPAGASMVFFVPGVGETLRVTGYMAEPSTESATIELGEAWVHC